MIKIESNCIRKNELFLLLFSRFFVTLKDFSAFLCIKAVWGIEGK